MAAPIGMIFRIDPYGNPQAEASLNTGAPWNDSVAAGGGDWILVVTGAPSSASQAAVAALITRNVAAA